MLVCSPEHVISVDSVNGHDNSSCLQSNGRSCQTLEFVQHKLKSITDNSVVIEICEPGINLTKAHTFQPFLLEQQETIGMLSFRENV